MEEVLGIEVFPYSILGLIMTGTDHDMLTKFVKIKLSTFVYFEIEDSLKLLLITMRGEIGIMEKHGVDFVTVQQQDEAKQWRNYAEC